MSSASATLLSASPASRPARGTQIVGATMLALVAAFTILLWPEWQQNPDLSHGFFAPLIFLLLIWESRRIGPSRWLPENGWTLTLTAIAFAFGVIFFALAGLLAASLSWSHTVPSFVTSASLCSFLFGGLLMLSSDRVRAIPFNWISFTAVFLWLLVAPLPSGTYARLTLSLQSWVTSSVLQALHLLGVPARQHGNILELATTTVGVEEACSGIRSLISCIYAGFFFAAWQVRHPAGRIVLILVAPLLALAMNFLRSLLLTLMANAGKDITGFWHDATGFAILGVTAAALAGLAILLETKSDSAAPSMPVSTKPPAHASSVFFYCGISLALAMGVFYFVSTRPAARSGIAPPNLSAALPAQPAGWTIQTTENLYEFSGILQTNHLMERTYVRKGVNAPDTQITVYVAYWEPGQASVSRVASHTPDACWPGAGWIARPAAGKNESLALPDRKIPAGEYRFFETASGFPQHVWFWHLHDGRVISYENPYSIPVLFRLALKYGFRRQGDQMFVRISSNRPWNEISHEPLVREIFAHFAPLGL